MSIIDSIKRCFGEGKIRFEGILEDGTKFTAKMDYIGDINTLNEKEVIEDLKRKAFVEYGWRIKEAKIVGYYWLKWKE